MIDAQAEEFSKMCSRLGFVDFLKLIRFNKIDPYMDMKIYFGQPGEHIGTWKLIQKFARTKGTEFELEKDLCGLYIEDADTFFRWRKGYRDEFRENVATFLEKLNQIQQILEINLCCTIRFTGVQ